MFGIYPGIYRCTSTRTFELRNHPSGSFRESGLFGNIFSNYESETIDKSWRSNKCASPSWFPVVGMPWRCSIGSNRRLPRCWMCLQPSPFSLFKKRHAYIYTYNMYMGAARFSGLKHSSRCVKRFHWRLLWYYMPQAADDRCSKQSAPFSWFYYHQTSRKQHAYKNGNDTSIHLYIYRYLSIYRHRYELSKNCWL